MNLRILSFYLGGMLFGVDISLVKEINRNIEFTPMPDSEENILGLFNMRGQIVVLYDLANALGHKIENKTIRQKCIIFKPIRDETCHIGFFIEEAGEVFDISQEILEERPANIANIQNDYISNIAKLDNELLIIINPENVFYND